MSKSEKLRTMFMYADFDRSTSASPKRRSSFASDMAASQFGGRYFGWREWGDFSDINPKTLDAKRKLALWRKSSS